jgi:hypothetical protein
MASNPFDQFDEQPQGQAQEYSGGNPFDQFDAGPVANEAPKQSSFQRWIGDKNQWTDPEAWKRAVGLAARTPIDAVTSMPIVAANAGVAARNLITGSDYQYPSQMYESAMGEVFPVPQTGTEKGMNILGSAVLGSKLPVPSATQTAPANFVRPQVVSQAQQVIAEGEKHGVPVFYDDVAQGPVAKKLGTAAESLPGPFGTGAGREVQAKTAQTAAGKVVDQFSTPAGDDIPVLVQKGLQTRLSSFREAANKLYTRAAQELDPLGNVQRAEFDQVIADEASKQSRLGTLASDDVVQLLEKYRNAPQGNFSTMREIRSQLGEEISDFYTGKNAAIGERGVTALRAMQQALERDMTAFAKQSGTKGYGAWRTADGFYKANIVPFKEAGFRDLVKTAEPEKAWRYLLAQGSLKSRSARMYNSLDEPGRAAVRYGLVKDAMGNGTNPNGSFSPAKFAKYLEDHDSAITTFFKGRDLQEVRGFQNLMRHVERAGQFAENPPTGNRLIPYLLGGAAVIQPAAAATIAGSGLTIRSLFQTKAGRDLLLAAGQFKPGSQQLTTLSNRIATFLATASARSAVQESDQEEGTMQ